MRADAVDDRVPGMFAGTAHLLIQILRPLRWLHRVVVEPPAEDRLRGQCSLRRFWRRLVVRERTEARAARALRDGRARMAR